MQCNPWETNSVFINVGGLNNILTVNKQFTNEEESVPTNTDHSASIQFINILKDLTRYNKEMHKSMMAVERKKLYKTFYDVLHTEVLDGLISMVDSLSSHLQQIIENKEKLVEHLHKPYLGDCIAIDSSYHEDICEFFPLIADNLAQLSKTLKNVEWVFKYSIRHTTLGQTLDTILSVVAYLQNHCQALGESRDLMGEVTRVQKKNNF